MPRLHALRACRTHNGGKRYLDTEAFHALVGTDRVEAYLWLCWPNARRLQTIQKVCRLKGGTAVTILAKTNKIVRAGNARNAGWRFKPGT